MKNCSFEYKKFQPCLTLETKKFSYLSDFINNSPKSLKNNMVAHEINCIDSSKSAIEIDKAKCISCMFCVFSCPGNLINIDDQYKLNSQCSDCEKIDITNVVSSENNLIKLPIIKSLKSNIKYRNFEDFTGINETKKILDHKIELTATCVRIPVMVSHSESLNIEFNKTVSLSEVRKVLAKAPGCKIIDDPLNNMYATPIDSAGKNETFISRIRQDNSNKNSINLWIVSDNLLRGAALNAVEIAETYYNKL